MRGNRKPDPNRTPVSGSIPAYAGEPLNDAKPKTLSTVYPRVCGGTLGGRPSALRTHGLSPRMRGNHAVSVSAAAQEWSIPAYAGEPPAYSTPCAMARVYPRVCGGTPSQRRFAASHPGLSPRMRGNRHCAASSSSAKGSIPAYAGEPRPPGSAARTGKVYPRVCGGTRGGGAGGLRRQGLSPRMRGNLHGPSRQQICIGSIPAYAGEPNWDSSVGSDS